MPEFIALATADLDLGILPASEARAAAAEIARELGVTVTLRDPMSDELLSEVSP